MVKKSTRPRGRPRKFQEGEALDQAIKVFWDKGYDGATIDDLVAEMGLCRPSLYATFGDKEALFMRCLEHYGHCLEAKTVQPLQTAPDVWKAVQGFLRQTVENATGENTPPGCLMACVVPSVSNEKVQEFAASALSRVEDVVERRLQSAMAAGELPAGFPCAMRSRQIVGTAMAFALRARVGTPREVLFADADDAAAIILSSCGSPASGSQAIRIQE